MYIATFAVLATVAVVAHELGHALVGQRFGLAPQITLVAFAGRTEWNAEASPSPSLTRRQRAAIYAAGPAVSIVVGLVAMIAKAGLASHASAFLNHAFELCIEVNLGWGVLNLLPILPLDGGEIVHGERRDNPRRQVRAHALSAAFGSLLVCGSMALAYPLLALPVAYFTWTNLRAFMQLRPLLQAENGRSDALKSAKALLLAGESETAHTMAELVRANHGDPAQRVEATRISILAKIAIGRDADAAALLSASHALLGDAMCEQLRCTLQRAKSSPHDLTL